MAEPNIQRFVAQNGKTLYRVGTSTNSKRLIFTTEELSNLGDLIKNVLGGTTDESRTEE